LQLKCLVHREYEFEIDMWGFHDCRLHYPDLSI
jgi:hypothetical protein